jgi:hypothetical protein
MMEAGFRREAHQQSMAQNVVRGALARRGGEGDAAGAAAPASAPGEGNGGDAAPAPGIDPMPLIAELLTALQRMNAPKRIVRDQAGKPIGIEPVTGDS